MQICKEEENKNHLESHHPKTITVKYCGIKTPKPFSVVRIYGWMYR